MSPVEGVPQTKKIASVLKGSSPNICPLKAKLVDQLLGILPKEERLPNPVLATEIRKPNRNPASDHSAYKHLERRFQERAS